MKFLSTSLLALLFTATGVHAQWVSKTYSLVPGWNGVWLAGDASYTTVADLLTAYPTVTEVWRWNPNPDSTAFTTSPSTPTTNTEEWTVWKKDGSETLLSRLVGNSSYLVRCSANTSLTIKQLVVPPTATWLISGANFLGFPAAGTASSGPSMSAYLASYPSATTTVLSTPSKIYNYIGGEMGPSNPMLVAPGTEKLDANKAYWFNVATVGNFTAPVEYEVASSAGLAFGRTQTTMSVGITNRSTSTLTLTIALGASEAAPTSQVAISGGVPLTRRIFDSATNSYSETAIGGSFTISLPASGRTTLDFGIDRDQMIGTADAFYASILRITDSANLSNVSLPVSGQIASPAGLWLVNTKVNQVSSTVPNSGSTTRQPFPLLFLAHMDSAGNARLLSQAFIGKLSTTGNPVGICISESRVLGFSASDLKPAISPARCRRLSHQSAHHRAARPLPWTPPCHGRFPSPSTSRPIPSSMATTRTMTISMRKAARSPTAKRVSPSTATASSPSPPAHRMAVQSLAGALPFSAVPIWKPSLDCTKKSFKWVAPSRCAAFLKSPPSI
jgi:hypothetical protein